MNVELRIALLVLKIMQFRRIFKSLLIIGPISLFTTAMATVNSPKLVSLNFPDSPNNEETTDVATDGGGSRGTPTECTGSVSIRPLMPENQVITTTFERPSFFWYLPNNTGFEDVELTLITKSEEVKIPVNIPASSGIIQFTLPEEIVLKENEEYNWKLTLNCSLDNETVEMGGKIVRNPLTQQQIKQLETATMALEKAELYAQFYLWEDTLRIMLELRETQPQAWQEFLNSVGITDSNIYQAPVNPL